MFRDFDYIAAIAFEAERAATNPDGTSYRELAESERMEQVQRVMGCARAIGEGRAWEGGSEDPYAPEPFEAVVRTVYGHNDGQGGLALERVVHLGQVMVDLELVDPAQAAGRDMVDCATELLAELVEMRRRPGGFASLDQDPNYIAREYREVCLSVAAGRVAGSAQGAVPAAKVFLEFLGRPQSSPWVRVQALRQAAGAVKPEYEAAAVVEVAEDYYQFLELPLAPDVKVAEAEAELEDATIQ